MDSENFRKSIDIHNPRMYNIRRSEVGKLKLSSAYVQAIGLLVMLAELPEDQSLKSSEISKRMEVSQSYLLKIATKLRKSQLIESSASKQGGYRLKKTLGAITFLDIFEAIEGTNHFLHDINLNPINAMFINQDLVQEKSQTVIALHTAAEAAYKEQLQQHYLVDILPKDENQEYVTIDWKKILKEQ